MRLNALTPGDFHAMRELLGELTGHELDPSVRVLPPFHTDGGRNLRFGRNVFGEPRLHRDGPRRHRHRRRRDDRAERHEGRPAAHAGRRRPRARHPLTLRRPRDRLLRGGPDSCRIVSRTRILSSRDERRDLADVMIPAMRAAQEIGSRFGLRGEPVPLPGELDRNFALDGHVLKLHAPSTTRACSTSRTRRWSTSPSGRRASRRRGSSARATAPPACPADGGFARVLTRVPGTPWARSPPRRGGAGAASGVPWPRSTPRSRASSTRGLDRHLHWVMQRAAELRGAAPAGPIRCSSASPRRSCRALRALPAQAIHNDANEHNVLVGDDGLVSGADRLRRPLPRAAGVRAGRRVRLRDGRPGGPRSASCCRSWAGYHEVAPLAAGELALLPDLIRTRLAMSIAMAALQRAEQPDNDYLLISQDGVMNLLGRVGPEPHELELLRLRAACGYEPVPTARAVRAHLQAEPAGPVCAAPLEDAPVINFTGPDPASPEDPAFARALSRGPAGLQTGRVRGRAARRAAHAAPRGRHLPPRRRADPRPARRHGPRGRGPAAGARLGQHRRARAHHAPRAWRFHTLYGHLSEATATGLSPGDALSPRRCARAPRHRGRERRLGPPPAPAAAHHRPRARQRRARSRNARRAPRVGVGQPGPEPAARPARRRARGPAARPRRAARRPPDHDLAPR